MLSIEGRTSAMPAIKRLEKLVRYTILCAAIGFVLIWGASLIKCEYLTYKHHDDFEYAYHGNTMLGKMEYFKVLHCSEDTAEVYYVSQNMSSGDVFSFHRQDDQWSVTDWNTIWSATSSASEVIWPYWWHFVYGGL